MHPTTTIPRPRGREMATALLLYFVTVAASVWLGAPRPITFGSTLASSAATAVGTLAMAFYLLRWTPYPRWGFLGAAAVLAASALIAPLVTSDPATWAKDARPMLWMHPWFLMVMTWTSPTTKRQGCAPDAPWAGWLLIGTAAVLALIASGAAALSRLM